MNYYPPVMSEDETMDAALAGRSLARFGDGELRLALNKSCASQVPAPGLVAELREILAGKTKALPCIPNILPSPRSKWWSDYADSKYTSLMRAKTFGSAFITRPDNMPSIDRPAFWDKVKALWEGRDVILVRGDEKSLTAERMQLWSKVQPLSIAEVVGPRRDAYASINEIEQSILHSLGNRKIPVLMCLGATATVLAHRLAKKGVWALDLGHVGMFMKSAGAYAFQPKELASDKYRDALRRMYREIKWGNTGWRSAGEVIVARDALHAESILDYGCGLGTLREALKPIRIYEYDPGIEDKDALPKPCHLVVCTNVLEHVEPELLSNVISHMSRLATKGIYIVISTRDAAWWLDTLRAAQLNIVRSEERGADLHVWTKT